MTISQALKEKNRLAGKISSTDTKIVQSGSWLKGNNPPYNLEELLVDRAKYVTELVELKTKISKASIAILPKILEMGEMKSYVVMLRGINTTEGTMPSYASSEPTVYECAINQMMKDTIIESTENKIAELQDDIDHYNATTGI